MAETTGGRPPVRRPRISRASPAVEAGRPPERGVRPTAFEARTPPPIPEATLHRDELMDEEGRMIGREAHQRRLLDLNKPIINALQSPENFIRYIEYLKHHIVDHRLSEGKPPLGDKALWAEISEEFENELILAYSKLYERVHTAQAGKFMEELAQENFMDSIQTAQAQLSLMVSRLADDLESAKPDSAVAIATKKMKFVSKRTQRIVGTKKVDTGEYDKDGNPIIKEIPQYKNIPIAGSESERPRDFLKSITYNAEEVLEAESFAHNVQVLFRKGAGEKGFWSQLSHYAEEKMSSSIMDALHHMPDSKAFIAASQLYTKYLQGEFAMLSWRHEATMFTPEIGKKFSKIQLRVMDDLAKLYPEFASGENSWRLERALNIGLGLSRGVFLTEPNNAAWADPGHKGKGEAAYQSYYTNDSHALLALNLQHHMDRWRTMSGNNGVMLHIPIAGIPFKLMRKWNHRKLWEQMQKREESYLKGDMAYQPESAEPKGKIRTFWSKLFKRFNKKEADETDRLLTMIDYMPNIGKVGSHLDRRGWRYIEAFDAWLERDKNGFVKPLESWKAFENIGYEAVKFLSENNGFEKKGAIGKAGTTVDARTNGEEKKEIEKANGIKELYVELYDRYINSQSVDSEGKPKARTADEKKDAFDRYFAEKCSGEKNPEGTFMSRVFVNLIRKRMPTKLLVLERDRQSPEGDRAWELVRKETGLDFGAMNKAVENLMLVELRVRQDVSNQMKEQLANQGEGNERLSGVNINNYEVNRPRIKSELDKLLTEGPHKKTEIENALKLFDKMNEFYDDNEGEYWLNFANKIRDNNKPHKHFPFAIAPEELDTQFASFKSAGETVLKRALGDLAGVEMNITGPIMKTWFGKLQELAINGKHDMSDIVTMMKGIKEQMEQIHGEGPAYELIHHLAYATIAYFRKDEVARGFFTKWFHMGKKHSLAAEFAGGNANLRNIVEWTPSDISKFCLELDRAQVLPGNAYSLMKGKVVERKLFGLIKYKTIEYEGDKAEYTVDSLRTDAGGTKSDLVKEYITKYLPMLAALALYMTVRKALKESEGKK